MCKEEGHENLRENLREKLGDRDDTILVLDREIQGLKGKSERAVHIKPKLDKWVAMYNKDRAPEDRVGTLSVDRITGCCLPEDSSAWWATSPAGWTLDGNVQQEELVMFETSIVSSSRSSHFFVLRSRRTPRITGLSTVTITPGLDRQGAAGLC